MSNQSYMYGYQAQQQGVPQNAVVTNPNTLQAYMGTYQDPWTIKARKVDGGYMFLVNGKEYVCPDGELGDAITQAMVTQKLTGT